MIKKINISRRMYFINSSALLKLKYDEMFNSDILIDLGAVGKSVAKLEEMVKTKKRGKVERMEKKRLMHFIYVVSTKLAYIMIMNCDKNEIINYKEFYKQAMKRPNKWADEVIQFASLTFLNKEMMKNANKKNEDTEIEEKEKITNNEFISLCKKVGLSISELNNLKYVDVVDIITVHFNLNGEAKTREATQSDFDKF